MERENGGTFLVNSLSVSMSVPADLLRAMESCLTTIKTLFSTSKNGSHTMQMNFTLILSQSVSKFDMGNCVLFYDVFMKWEGPQQLLKVWFCKLKVFMWILTCMLYVSIVVTYIFTVNEFSITKTNFTFSCKIKKSEISNSLCCRFFSSQFILFLPGSFLTTVGNFS